MELKALKNSFATEIMEAAEETVLLIVKWKDKFVRKRNKAYKILGSAICIQVRIGIQKLDIPRSP